MGKFNYETKMGTDASQGIIVWRMQFNSMHMASYGWLCHYCSITY